MYDLLTELVQDLGLAAIDKPTADDILQTCSDVARHTYNAEGGTRSLTRYDIHGHQTTQEGNQHTDSDTEQHHRGYIYPICITAIDKDDVGYRQHHARHKSRHLTVALEQYIRHPTCQHRAHDAEQCVNRDDECCRLERKALLLLQEEDTPRVERVARDIHKCRCEGQNPYGRGTQHLLLDIAHGLILLLNLDLLACQDLNRRQTLALGCIVHHKEDDDNAYSTRQSRAEEAPLPAGYGNERADEDE